MNAISATANETAALTSLAILPAKASAAAAPCETGRSSGSAGLVSRLAGVPKGALKAVLGKELGIRAWWQARGKMASDAGVADYEIVVALLRHLSQRAARELQAGGRQAKFARLTVCYQDGSSASNRARLAGLTQEANDLFEAAVRLFGNYGRPAVQVQSVNLDVTAVTASTPSSAANFPSWLAMPARIFGR